MNRLNPWGLVIPLAFLAGLFAWAIIISLIIRIMEWLP